MLGHDLRNPLASIQAGAELLLKRGELADRPRHVVEQMQVSGKRMGRLIEDVLDFARGRLGGGLALADRPAVQLQPVLEQVVTELRNAHPGRAVRAEMALARPVTCDPDRMAQMLSNLLANALTHGAAGGEVQVMARADADGFELMVSNPGQPIPEAARAQLFKPFTRQLQGEPSPGLGLGLYIASQIAHAHGGTLDVESDAAVTRFTFRMPV